MFRPVIGIQLYTLRNHTKTAQDFDTTLARLEKMGVDTVQISAIGDIPGEAQRDILRAHNMKCCVTHKSYDKINNNLDELIAEHKLIDCDALGIGSAPDEFRGNKKNVLKFIEFADGVGRKLKENGMTFHYHNHNFEFYRLMDSKFCMMDFLINDTDPETFKFIPDLAWIHYAGADPVEMLYKMKGRVKVVHFKDYIFEGNGDRRFVTLGNGYVDLEACYKACIDLEIPYIMYEHDIDWPDDDPFKACEQSWDYLKNLEAKF